MLGICGVRATRLDDRDPKIPRIVAFVYIEETAVTDRQRSRWAVLVAIGFSTDPVLGATRAVAADNVADAPTPYVPICPNCGQEGREHTSSPEPGRHFICVVCDTRWTVQARNRKGNGQGVGFGLRPWRP